MAPAPAWTTAASTATAGFLLFAFAPFLLAPFVPGAEAHGRLIEPPSRASMWRYGFDTPPDYNDHELYCGGFSRQWRRNEGRCGVCGDAWDLPEPRPHEAGGRFGKGPVVRRWRQGSAVPIRVELTANHRGYFEFRLCPRDRAEPEATQQCLDAHLLQRAPGARGGEPGEARYFPEAGANRVFEARYLLPDEVTCKRCVLQWRYVAGNNWGRCENGTEAVGCGPQEEFRACADVAISAEGDEGKDELPPEDVDENALPGEGEGEEGEGEGEPLPAVPPTAEGHSSRPWWAVLALIVCAGLAAATALLLVYVYYYHAADLLKQWLRERRPPHPHASA